MKCMVWGLHPCAHRTIKSPGWCPCLCTHPQVFRTYLERNTNVSIVDIWNHQLWGAQRRFDRKGIPIEHDCCNISGPHGWCNLSHGWNLHFGNRVDRLRCKLCCRDDVKLCRHMQIFWMFQTLCSQRRQSGMDCQCCCCGHFLWRSLVLCCQFCCARPQFCIWCHIRSLLQPFRSCVTSIFCASPLDYFGCCRCHSHWQQTLLCLGNVYQSLCQRSGANSPHNPQRGNRAHNPMTWCLRMLCLVHTFWQQCIHPQISFYFRRWSFF